MASTVHTYSYGAPSSFTTASGSSALKLATSGLDVDPVARPYFFDGVFTAPKRAADLLLGVSTIVGSRFFVPPNMLAKILALADPVITSSREHLRFEGFSSCCGVYARADLLPDAVKEDFRASGTTNVDFNADMRSALSRVSAQGDVRVSVGNEEFSLSDDSGEVIEKKVKLPDRWIRGFAETQIVQAGLDERFIVTGPSILKFLRSLPKTAKYGWITKHGRSLRLSQLQRPESVFVAGLERLAILQRLAHHASKLTIYGGEADGASAFCLDCGDSRFTLVLSPSVWRGLSGEGGVLLDLAQDLDESILVATASRLTWDHDLPVSSFKDPLARTALGHLAASGLVGFDLTENSWFKRVLPFSRADLESKNPRLREARKLIQNDCVTLTKLDDSLQEFAISSKTSQYRVRIQAEGASCTCPWYAKHQGDRGPCKHVLAAKMFVQEGQS